MAGGVSVYSPGSDRRTVSVAYEGEIGVSSGDTRDRGIDAWEIRTEPDVIPPDLRRFQSNQQTGKRLDRPPAC